MAKGTTQHTIDEILSRGVGEFIDPGNVFREKLEKNPTSVVIKLGVDPTRPDIHLGHAVILQKLRQFQELGAKVVFLIGDFTSQIGDPTGKSKLRPEVGAAEVKKNMATYLNQVGKILKEDPKVFSWITNSDWYVSVNDILAPGGASISITVNKKKFKSPPLSGNHVLAKAAHWEKTRMQKGPVYIYTWITVLSILRKITLSRLVERDMFQERMKKSEPVFMHEIMYPVIQGIDSDAIANIYGSCDLEVGGTDQHFNMLLGREVMEMNKKTPQAVLSFKLLEGLDGTEKMSKSLGNYVGITDEPEDMYGKIMSIPDSSIVNYYELCTFTPLAEVESIKEKLGKGEGNPKEIKMALAKQIVSIYHGEKKSERAEEDWISKFQRREIPEKVEEVKNGGRPIDVLVASGIAGSASVARRLFDSGSVTDMTTGEKIGSKTEFVKGHTYKIGKHNFIKIV
jgi:tyrosyl-tRNA synthetase